jgi:hypothetical protein
VPSGSPVVRSSFAAGPIANPGAAEVVVGTVDGIQSPVDDELVRIVASGTTTVDAATTDVLATIRRGGLTGHVVATLDVLSVTAATNTALEFTITGTDSPGDVDGETYVLTLTQTASAGATQAAQVSMIAIVGP